MQEALNKVRTLVEALPYIKKFHNQIIVIKYGGSAMVEPHLSELVAQDVTLLKYVGLRPVIVHGGGKEISHWLKKIGKETVFVDGLRVTDEETMEITEMVLVGKVKKGIMHGISKIGGKCVGLSGKDNQFILAKVKDKSLGLVGEVTAINTELLNTLLSNDYIPVISPIGVDEQGNSYNINADHTASAIAKALKASKLILLTDVAGVLDQNSQVIQKIPLAEISSLITEGIVSGGMLPKLRCCEEALSAGVGSAHIIDGRLEHSLLLEIFTDQGIGSMVLS